VFVVVIILLEDSVMVMFLSRVFLFEKVFRKCFAFWIFCFEQKKEVLPNKAFKAPRFEAKLKSKGKPHKILLNFHPF
jgi:hypothetical protein